MTSECANMPRNAEAVRGKDAGRSPGSSPTNNVPTPARGGRAGERRERNATALEELMRKRGVDEAWNSLEEMQQQGVKTDKYTISRMLMKTVGDGRSRMNHTRIYRGIVLVEKFIDLQPKDVDEVLLNALLDTCCRLKDLNRLESVVQRMRDLQITPSPVTLGILVKTYGQAGDIQKVLQVWDEMETQRVQANAVTYGCMIDACVKCNHLDKAVEIFQGMRETGKHRNTILYTTLIKGFGLDKNLNKALELFREMPLENVPYNTITYNSIIDACVKGGEMTTAEALLRDITSPNNPLEPDLITFSTVLKGYCHAGELDKALQVVEAIKMKGLRCDELVYNTLMDGCVKANDVTAGVGLFEEMVHNGMRPSAITHSILARLYQRAGYEEDASEAVAQLYAHHGIERPTGGDRGKGAGRRHGGAQRSPMSRGGASPTASPMSGFGMSHDGFDGFINGYDGFSNPSNASTPCASPHHPTGGHGNGFFLPLDATRGMVPPFPGMSGSETPGSQYGSSCAGGTPVNGGYGNYGGSPCMSPTGMDQCQGLAQGQWVAAPSVTMVAGPSGTGMPSMPPFPFNAAPGACPQGYAPMDTATPQFFSVPMTQAAPGTFPVGSGGGTPTSFMAGGANPYWPGQVADAQQSPFPMPLSSPHDLVQNCQQQQQQQQPQLQQQQQMQQNPAHLQHQPQMQQPQQPQAYFEFMQDGGNMANGSGGVGSNSNPFCL